MASSYRGLYRVGPTGHPTDIQVVDTRSVSLPLPLDKYLSRAVLPDWRTLTTQGQWRVLESVVKIECGESGRNVLG